MIYNHKLHMGESPKHKSEQTEANTKKSNYCMIPLKKKFKSRKPL